MSQVARPILRALLTWALEAAALYLMPRFASGTMPSGGVRSPERSAPGGDRAGRAPVTAV